MAVFRKRLSSCFFAFRRSLERRRDLIAAISGTYRTSTRKGEVAREAAEEEDDEEVDPGTLVVRERQLGCSACTQDPARRDELERDGCTCRRTSSRSARYRDSKYLVFEEQLQELVHSGQRVIVFTQYLDTLDYIRNQLIARYGDRIACYSGRGGEIWDPVLNDWRVVDKAEVKARARRDDPRAIQILLGTDAASTRA